MTKKRKTGLAIGAVAACITAKCAAGACNGIAKEEKAVLPAATTSTAAIITTTPPPTTVIAATAESTAVTTVPPQITTTATCSTTETTTTTTAEQTTPTETTVQLTTTDAPATTTAPAPAEPYNGQTSGDYIYAIGFGWVFNEGGGSICVARLTAAGWSGIIVVVSEKLNLSYSGIGEKHDRKNKINYTNSGKTYFFRTDNGSKRGVIDYRHKTSR